MLFSIEGLREFQTVYVMLFVIKPEQQGQFTTILYLIFSRMGILAATNSSAYADGLPQHQPWLTEGARWHNGEDSSTASPDMRSQWSRIWDRVATPSHAAVAIATVAMMIMVLFFAWRCAVFWHEFNTPLFWARYPSCCLQAYNNIRWGINRHRNWFNQKFVKPFVKRSESVPVHCIGSQDCHCFECDWDQWLAPTGTSANESSSQDGILDLEQQQLSCTNTKGCMCSKCIGY